MQAYLKYALQVIVAVRASPVQPPLPCSYELVLGIWIVQSSLCARIMSAHLLDGFFSHIDQSYRFVCQELCGDVDKDMGVERGAFDQVPMLVFLGCPGGQWKALFFQGMEGGLQHQRCK